METDNFRRRIKHLLLAILPADKLDIAMYALNRRKGRKVANLEDIIHQIFHVTLRTLSRMKSLLIYKEKLSQKS